MSQDINHVVMVGRLARDAQLLGGGKPQEGRPAQSPDNFEDDIPI